MGIAIGMRMKMRVGVKVRMEDEDGDGDQDEGTLVTRLAPARWLGGALLASLLLMGCSKTEEPPPSEAARSSAAAPAKPSPPPGATDVTWDPPASWTKADKPGPMRKATYTVPRAPGDAEDGELSVSQAGGTVDQNVARWAGQLERRPEDAKRISRTVNGLRVTVVEIHGDYAGMTMPGAPASTKKPGWALLGAIVETSPPTFFKLTGPDKTLMLARPDFDKLVESLHAK
jgi:hypothetical protein